MSKNNKLSLIAHFGICLIVLFMGGYQTSIFYKIVFVGVGFLLYFVIGSSLSNQGSWFKNLLSVSYSSLLGLVLSLICVVVYQLQVINIYDYTFEPIIYKIIRTICYAYDSSITPIAALIGERLPSFYLPYGWVLTFYFPSLILWLGLEWKSRKDNIEEKQMRRTNILYGRK